MGKVFRMNTTEKNAYNAQVGKHEEKKPFKKLRRR
jgi:hypothetical protein